MISMFEQTGIWKLWSTAGQTPCGLWNKIWYCVMGGQEFLFLVPLLNSLEYLQQILCGFGDGAKGSHTIEEMQSRCLSWNSTCTFHFGMTPMSKRSALPLDYLPCSVDAYFYNVELCSWRFFTSSAEVHVFAIPAGFRSNYSLFCYILWASDSYH